MKIILCSATAILLGFTIRAQDLSDSLASEQKTQPERGFHLKNMTVSENGLSGEMAMPGSTDKHGSNINCYESGKKKSEGYYYRNYKIGTWQSWYENGALRSKENYTGDTVLIDKIITEGLLNLGYNYNTGAYFIKASAIFSGVSEWYYDNGQVSSREEWGKTLLSVVHWSETGKKQKVPVKNKTIEEMIYTKPELDSDLGKFTHRDLITRQSKDSKGSISLSFVIHEDGTVSGVKVSGSSKNKSLDQNAVSIIEESSGHWTTAREHNLPIKNYQYNLTINFR